MEEQININVIIADRPYRLKINPSEEEKVRRAAKEVNNKVKSFQSTYEAKDKQDYLAMAALLFAVEVEKGSRPAEEDNSELYAKLNELDQTLADFLK